MKQLQKLITKLNNISDSVLHVVEIGEGYAELKISYNDTYSWGDCPESPTREEILELLEEEDDWVDIIIELDSKKLKKSLLEASVLIKDYYRIYNVEGASGFKNLQLFLNMEAIISDSMG